MSSPNTGAPKANLGAPKGYYDPDFTVDISKKMQVPEKIKLAPNSITNGVDGMLQDPAIVGFKKVNDNTEWMRVPDRICVVGNDSYLGTRQAIPEQQLEESFLGKPNTFDSHVQMATLPSKLRVEDAPPIFETPVKKLDKALKSVDGAGGGRSVANQSRLMNDSFMDYEDSELNSQSYLQLRRRLVQITQRLDSLEIENRRRDKRDYLLYTSLFLYILFRGLKFVASQQNQF